MQQKFKIGDKVKVLTNVYPGAYGTEGVVKQVDTKSSHVYVVEQGICDGQMDCMYGHFDHDSWRYCFYERELELVEDKPEPDYVIGQEVYVSNDFNRYLRKGVLLDAIPRNGLMHVNIGGFDCFVEEERVYTKEMKGD